MTKHEKEAAKLALIVAGLLCAALMAMYWSVKP